MWIFLIYSFYYLIVFVYDQKENMLWIITHYIDEREEAEKRLDEWKSLG